MVSVFSRWGFIDPCFWSHFPNTTQFLHNWSDINVTVEVFQIQGGKLKRGFCKSLVRRLVPSVVRGADTSSRHIINGWRLLWSHWPQGGRPWTALASLLSHKHRRYLTCSIRPAVWTCHNGGTWNQGCCCFSQITIGGLVLWRFPPLWGGAERLQRRDLWLVVWLVLWADYYQMAALRLGLHSAVRRLARWGSKTLTPGMMKGKRDGAPAPLTTAWPSARISTDKDIHSLA